MSKYFKNVKSYNELKSTYKELLKANHPDNGGDLEKMQEINAEYDVLFKIWKDRAYNDNSLSEEEKAETAQSTRSSFYTSFGWEGSNHDWSRSLKEVAQIVRTYVKEKYPTYKFSVRTSYASMCQELHVELKESPIEVYKSFEELTEDDKSEFFRKANRNGYWSLDCWNDSEFEAEYNRIISEHGKFFKIMNEVTTAVVKDVDDFVNSYNYEDCDGMIDYFHVDFYYFGCAENNGQNIKIVPKTLPQGGTKKITKYFLGRWKNFLSSKTRQLGGFSYFFSFITISKSSPNASAICRISFSEKLSRFIFCERFCELVSISLARSVTLNSFSISVCFTIFANNVPPPLS